MEIKRGGSTAGYGPGVLIELSGDELAAAVDRYIAQHGVQVKGPRTVHVNGLSCACATVFVDPSGSVVSGNCDITGRGDYQIKVKTAESG